MFGFSFAELLIVFFVIIVFIKPEDLPEIARFLGRLYFKAKNLIEEIKKSLKSIEKDLGINEIKSEIEREIAKEKMKIEEEAENIQEIVDIYGNIHKVDIENIKKHLADEEIKKEIERYNNENRTTKIAESSEAMK